jgi:hypothetical protein
MGEKKSFQFIVIKIALANEQIITSAQLAH